MADPDLQIRGGGGGHPDPEVKGGSLKRIFSVFSFFCFFIFQFDVKIRGVWAPRGPSPGTAFDMYLLYQGF